MPDPDSNVLIVVPAKDEEATIGEVLQDIRLNQPTAHILVVNDGSTDATVRIARENGAEVVSHETNLGVAAAIQTGRVYAVEHGYDFLVFCDADGQHRPADISAILKPLVDRDADFVIGSRELGRYSDREPFPLKVSRRFCSLAITLLARKHITDTTSGFKGWNRKVMECFKAVYETSERLHLGTTNDMEEILLARHRGFRIREVPVKMRDRVGGVSKVYTTRTLLHFLTLFPLNMIRTVLRNLR